MNPNHIYLAVWSELYIIWQLEFQLVIILIITGLVGLRVFKVLTRQKSLEVLAAVLVAHRLYLNGYIINVAAYRIKAERNERAIERGKPRLFICI